MLKKRFRILAKVKEICQKSEIYKFGVQVPIDAAEDKKLDDDNGNKLWQYATKEYMDNSQADFQILGHEDKH